MEEKIQLFFKKSFLVAFFLLVSCIFAQQCEKGQYLNNLNTCTDCEAGSYSETGIGNTKCSVCPAGKYTNTTGASSCKNCTSGTYSYGVGEPNCRYCTIGKYQNEHGAYFCKRCNPGMYSSTNALKVCFACPAGLYQSMFAGQSCKDCPKGYHGWNVSNKEYGISCKGCAKGKYGETSGSKDHKHCKDCDAGRYSHHFGLSFTKIYDLKPCTACQGGRWNSKVASASVVDCKPCLPVSIILIRDHRRKMNVLRAFRANIMMRLLLTRPQAANFARKVSHRVKLGVHFVIAVFLESILQLKVVRDV